MVVGIKLDTELNRLIGMVADSVCKQLGADIEALGRKIHTNNLIDMTVEAATL